MLKTDIAMIIARTSAKTRLTVFCIVISPLVNNYCILISIKISKIANNY